jgi:hypothetical protein
MKSRADKLRQLTQAAHSATGTLTALSRDTDKGTAELLEDQRPAIEARRWLNGQFGQNTPREQSPTSIEGNRRPQPRQTMASALYRSAKGLIFMAYTLTSQRRVSSVASCEWIRAARNIS